jgi:hypothetical protein
MRGVTGRDPHIHDWTSERTHQRSAVTTYRAGPVVLVSETAHVTHKLIGTPPSRAGSTC